jgi:beta-N-acetylhexosaminidase
MQSNPAAWSLDALIGQVFMVGFPATTPSPELLELIRQQRVGGIILFSRNVRGAQQVLELTRSLQQVAKEAGHPFPLLIAIDQENGTVQRLKRGTTQFPGNMALGATGSEQLAYEVALAAGRELKALGINMNLAPVVDVNNNPANPVIGVRSFGESPDLVARLGAAQVRGYREAGIICTLKHFPGHGDTAVDSHLSLPVIPHSLERLETVELVPFKRGIEAGADCVMSAHVAFPALTGNMEPATLSPIMMRELLRSTLGFEGVIISDCLEMRAISNTVGVAQGSVMTLQAGTDLVLVSHSAARQRGAIAAVQTAVQEGHLSLAALQQAAIRVLKLKERLLSWEKLPSSTLPAEVGDSAHTQLRDAAYALSTTLISNDEKLVPLHLEPTQNILVLFLQRSIPSMVQDQIASTETLVQSMRHYHPHVSSLAIPSQPTPDENAAILQAAHDVDAVILVTTNAYQDHNEQHEQLVRHLLKAEQRMIGLAVGSPYDPLAFPRLTPWLVTYEHTCPALEAATRVLFGLAQASGRLPVTLSQ